MFGPSLPNFIWLRRDEVKSSVDRQLVVIIDT